MPKSLILHYIITLLLTIFLVIIIVAIPSSHKRYAIFAGYNPNGIIEPYIITYLKGLNEVTDGIVYITDSPLQPDEAKKLKSINIIHQKHIRHHEYDWGSYKRGFNWLKNNGYLDIADELIFANDSCYAPLTSFKPMFREMSKRKDLDFWGDLQNTHFTNHVQSYFMVFRKPIITSKAFDHFINSITHQPDSSLYILKYEIELTPMLESLGYKWDSYLPYKKLSYLPIRDKNSYPLTLIRNYKHQFLKRRTFTEKLMILENIDELLNYLKTNYKNTYYDILSAHHPSLKHLENRKYPQ